MFICFSLLPHSHLKQRWVLRATLLQLEALDLGDNRLTGTVPDSWHNLSNVGACSPEASTCMRLVVLWAVESQGICATRASRHGCMLA